MAITIDATNRNNDVYCLPFDGNCVYWIDNIGDNNERFMENNEAYCPPMY